MPLGSITNAPLSGTGAEPEEVKKLAMIAIKMITNNVFKTKLRVFVITVPIREKMPSDSALAMIHPLLVANLFSSPV
jgi:DUF917 family protein